MSDWVKLRTFAEGWVDHMISAEPDAEARAVFAANRDRIVNEVEADMLRQVEQQQQRLH